MRQRSATTTLEAFHPPRGLGLGEWPPNPVPVYGWRQQQIGRLKADAKALAGARHYYRTRPVEFINHWVDTYDPRNAGSELPARLPLQMFPKQVELVEFLHVCLKGEAPGLIEKARDMGATWVCVAFSVWLWLFWPGAAVGWGSRKEILVDKIGDPDSIFQKMRMILRGLPRFFWPDGFDPDRDMSFMKIINPETGATITGESGDNIGRGGRKLIYFKDESAHYERPELIEAALGDNTRVQIDISSVNGLGNVFHRRRESGIEFERGGSVDPGRVNVFVMDWRDHPGKTQEWYDKRRARAVAEGLLHTFAQEVDRDYAASVEGVVIPAEWVKSAIDAHIKLGIEEDGQWCAALDVADGGMDRNALSLRKGIILRRIEEWGDRDTGVTTRTAIAACRQHAPLALQYDCIGVGAGVKSEANRLQEVGDMPEGIELRAWDAGASPLDKDRPMGRLPNGDYDRNTPLNGDYFANLKAQGWWELRRRFEKTHNAVTLGVEYDHDELISIDSAMPKLRQLEKELSQPTMGLSARMKLLIEKTPEGTRSPNMADTVMMNYWPVPAPSFLVPGIRQL